MESSNDKVHSTLFKDNLGALEIVSITKFCPITNHLKCRLHHFRSYVDDTN